LGRGAIELSGALLGLEMLRLGQRSFGDSAQQP